METKGKLQGVSKDRRSGKWLVTFLVDYVDENGAQAVWGVEGLDITAKPHREKRSLNANAYFHKLVTLIAEKLGASLQEIKNRLIREYGQFEYIGESIPTYLIKAEYQDAIMNKEGVHFCPVGYAHEGGNDYVKMAVMRGSHTYDTKEMSRLIDGTVEEAKELGIETLPPEQIERMVSAWRNTKEQ